MPTETPALKLESTDLSIAQYRALREGRDAAPPPAESVVLESAAAEPDGLTPGETAVEETDPTNETEEAKESKPKAAKGDKLNARFSELTAKIRTLETQLAVKGAGPTETTKPAAIETPAPAPDPNDPEPNPEKFENYVDWQKSWNRWDRRQDTRAAEAARVSAEQKTASAARAETWAGRVAEAKAELADFETVAQNPDLPVSPVMADAIVESEIGARVLYHLGQHPDEAARIAKLSPVAQIREIGKLEAKLETPTPAAEETETPQTKKLAVSKAPAPHKPVGGAAASNPAKNLEGMTQAEYRALRESGKLR